MGLFGKSKKELLEWQNLIVDTPVNRLLMTEKQLNIHSKPIIDNHIRILNDSVNLCNTTKKPDVFFSRYATQIEKAQLLCQFSKFVRFEGGNPAQILQQIIQERPISTRNFITRCFDDIEQLKTASAKSKRYQKLLKDLYTYRDRMDPENLSYLENTCMQRIEDLSKQTKSAKTDIDTELFQEINKHIRQIQIILNIPYDLTVNPFYTDPKKTRMSREPLTKTGREPKYPNKLHYETPMGGEWRLGDIWLLPDGSIGKARAISWFDHNGYQVHLALVDGALTVKKVEFISDRNFNGSWETLYKI